MPLLHETRIGDGVAALESGTGKLISLDDRACDEKGQGNLYTEAASFAFNEPGDLRMDCLFCKIVDGSIPATRVYEDESVIAFRDIHPQAPVHLLVVPKRHIQSLAETENPHDEVLLGHLLAAVATIAREEKLEKGYRVAINTGPDGGQTVDHLHLHLLGGRHMGWPPG